MQKTALKLGSIALCALSISACGETQTFKLVTGITAATMHDVFKRTDVNLKAKNYAAADFIESRMNGIVRKQDSLALSPLVQSDNITMTSPLGHNIPEGIGLRLSELGYNVRLGDAINIGKPVELTSEASKFTLGGTYLRGKKNVDINLQVIENATGNLITRFEYQLPLNKEIRELSNTETRIFRVQK
ncbi:MAG: FlgO family outer membrane protein [Alphaproteobacteria bacterium]|nr:FlgO family outer membrane protein [Alphaproteobacteria bacterium]